MALFLAFQCATAAAANPAVEATLALPRTEPQHYVEAALALTDLGAASEANSVAEEFAQLGMSDEQMVLLVDQVGTARLTRLGRQAPAATATVDRALAAAYAAANSPERLGRLVERLAGDREQAVDAIRALRNTGATGVAFCLDQIIESNDAKVRARLREALVALDPISQPALFDAAGSDNPQVAEQAAYALGRLAELHRLRTPIAPALVAGNAFQPGAAGDAARWAYRTITGQPPTTAGAKSHLASAIDELLAGAVLFTDATPVAENFEVQLAARLASDLAELDPSSRSAARRAYLLNLETGAEGNPDEFATYDLSTALDEALSSGLFLAAQRCCEALGQRRDTAGLAGNAGEPAPLARALEAGHPAVRFAAVEAVLAINPTHPFPGSSGVADSLMHFASATGENVAVVAYPQLSKAGLTAGWLLGAGYAATPANRGEDAVRIATESPDTQLVLIDMSVSLPGARETLFRLRRSPATALTPVAVIAPDGRLAEAHRIAEEHGRDTGRVIALPRPHSAEATQSLAESLLALATDGLPDSETRLARSEAAREAIARIVAEGPSFYGMADHADRVASLSTTASGPALATLTELGTPESQLRLLDAASLEARPVEDRNAAAEAFARSVQQHGVLLTTSQIRRQYDRYNLSATASAETQQVLGRLLDILEGAAE